MLGISTARGPLPGERLTALDQELLGLPDLALAERLMDTCWALHQDTPTVS